MNKRRHWYEIFGGAVLLMFSWALYTGWTWTDVDEVKQVPKSVRDNPGAYRAHYASRGRYYGGK